MALKKRLQDASLRAIVAQYVSLDIDTTTPDWGTWSTQFKHDGNGIPIVYIVRADGHVLYGKSGAIEGGELPRFLASWRKQAGAVLTAKQHKDLSAALEKAQKAHEAGEQATAVRELGKFSQANSYAAVVMQGKELAAKLLEEAKADLQKAEQQLGSEDEALQGAVTLARVQRIYRPFKEVIKSAGQLRSKYQKEKEKKELLAQADQIDAAARLEDDKAFDRARKAYERVVQRYPDSPAARLAQERIEKLGEPRSSAPPKKAEE